MNELDKIFLPVQRALDTTSLAARAVARNIANASTPGYRRQEVSFEGLLEAARLQDRERKLAALEAYRPQIREDPTALPGPGGNSVDVDRELVLLQQIELRHQLGVRMANGKLNSLRLAISGRA